MPFFHIFSQSYFLNIFTTLIILANIEYICGSSPSRICNLVSSDGDASLSRIEESISANAQNIANGDTFAFCDQERSSSCYALFSSTKSTTKIISAGCLHKNASGSSGIGSNCGIKNCTALHSHLLDENEEDERKSKTGFCCCTASLCNKEISRPVNIQKSDPVVLELLEELPPMEEEESEKRNIFLVIIAVISLFSLIIILITALLLRRHFSKLLNPFDADAMMKSVVRSEEQKVVLELGVVGEGAFFDKNGNTIEKQSTLSKRNISTTSRVIDSSNVRLMKLIGQGRYGTVWHALLIDAEQEVAVKLYKSEHKLYYNNEMLVYQSPLMKHPNIVSFIAGSWRLNEESGLNEYMLIMDYIPNGSLMSFLTHNSFKFESMVKLALSAATGLANLHTEKYENGVVKPAIVHRDFNSRNVLVKRDGSCAVSDLGFARKVSSGDVQSSHSNSLIPDVGTLRYMPPEVLEGSVDLNKCESALKQIDIYALALVLWEISSRCDDLYSEQGQGQIQQRSPPFKLPFEAELGHQLKFDEMRTLVSVRQGRPKFSPQWQRDQEAVVCLIDTIQDSWDQDSEARLTAACVVCRLATLPSLWNRSPLAVDGVNVLNNLDENTLLNDTEHQFNESGRVIEVSVGGHQNPIENERDELVSDQSVV